MTKAFLSFAFSICFITFAHSQTVNDKPKVNQLGYYPEGPKLAITPEIGASSFTLKKASDSSVVYQGSLSNSVTNSPSGEDVKVADFSDFTEAGYFFVEIEGGESSFVFGIGDNVFDEVTDGILKAFYFNRASAELKEEFAGKWSRPIGHPDTNVEIHPSAASENRPSGSKISSPKGWYDAGDFGKYVVPLSMSVSQLLFAYEQFPGFFEDQNLNIPESESELPDVLDESLWGLRWLLTMQDPDDGGVYHKLTTANFAGANMPHQATAQRYVVQKATAATLDFAAAMAQAARVYKPFLPEFADSALSAAEAAWQWAESNPNVSYNQSSLPSPAINTGAYGDGNFDDERFWATSELYITTQNDSYYDKAGWNNSDIGNPGWSNVQALGLYSLVHHRENLTTPGLADTAAMKTKLINSFSWYVDDAKLAGYRSAAGQYDWQFYWGSNGGFGNLAMAFLQLYQLTDNSDYYDATVHIMDYLLGLNSLDHSYITGFGDRPPMHIHHRQSQADGIDDPVPGWIAGGANPSNQNQDCGSSAYSSTLPALSYLDDWCSYSTNEITTYWNSPAVYALSGLQYLTPETGKVLSSNERSSSVPNSFGLKQNYPNPFNPSTNIEFELEKPGYTTLSVFDSLGRLVETLIDEFKTAGDHSVAFNAESLSTGIYFYRLATADYTATRQMLLIK